MSVWILLIVFLIVIIVSWTQQLAYIHYLTAIAGYVFQGCVGERERERERKLGQRPIEMSFHSTVYPSEEDVYAL